MQPQLDSSSVHVQSSHVQSSQVQFLEGSADTAAVRREMPKRADKNSFILNSLIYVSMILDFLLFFVGENAARATP